MSTDDITYLLLKILSNIIASYFGRLYIFVKHLIFD